MGNEFETRKEIRLKGYDYSRAGAYFVTICTDKRKQVLSEVIQPTRSVGDGAFDVPQIRLTRIGEIVQRNLLSSERISGVKIDHYVIMPDHIHAIIFLDPEKYVIRHIGTSRAPSPTNEMLPHVVSVFKRFCNKEIGYNIFQRSYAEHIIRDRDDYLTRRKYIRENPVRWYYKHMSDRPY